VADGTDKAQTQAGDDKGDEHTQSDSDGIWIKTESVRGSGGRREDVIQRTGDPKGGESQR